MASLVTPSSYCLSSGTGTGTRTGDSMSMYSCYCNNNSNNISLAVDFKKSNNKNKAGGLKLKVKAMGMGSGGGGGSAKYKGTQMREKQLTEMIEKKVIEAKEVCEGDNTSDECKVAWDEVEEVSQAKADLRFKLDTQHDPLEFFCQDHPDTDECRVYED